MDKGRGVFKRVDEITIGVHKVFILATELQQKNKFFSWIGEKMPLPTTIYRRTFLCSADPYYEQSFD